VKLVALPTPAWEPGPGNTLPGLAGAGGTCDCGTDEGCVLAELPPSGARGVGRENGKGVERTEASGLDFGAVAGTAGATGALAESAVALATGGRGAAAGVGAGAAALGAPKSSGIAAAWPRFAAGATAGDGAWARWPGVVAPPRGMLFSGIALACGRGAGWGAGCGAGLGVDMARVRQRSETRAPAVDAARAQPRPAGPIDPGRRDS
jgi:hypothetical protein